VFLQRRWRKLAIMHLQSSSPARDACSARASRAATHAPSPAARRDNEDDETARLLRAAADGDPNAWNALVTRHGSLLRSIARSYRLNSADVDDVVQTTWLRLVEHLSRIRTPGALRGWLAMTARRECLKTLRLQARYEPTARMPEVAAVHDDALEVDARLMRSERDEALWHAFGRLPARDQLLLDLLLADVPYQQISTSLKIPVGSIGPTRARSLSRLRREAGRAGLLA
jgi:RNA polymerase sigma factor (sigma-70 family)